MADTTPITPMELPTVEKPLSDAWVATLHAGAAKNCPTLLERVRDSVLTPAIVAAISTFIILVWLRPQFVQRKQSSKIALPTLNYGIVLLITACVFVAVLVLPRFF